MDDGALGVVLANDGWAFQLVHGESLVACASWALGAAGVTMLDASVEWPVLVELEQPIVIHDARCPMTPPEFITECVARSRADQVSLVGVRPVSDTIKTVESDEEGSFVGATVDRSHLVQVAAPLVLTPEAAARFEAAPADIVDLVRGWPMPDAELRQVLAPPEARRVSSREDIRLLEALTRR